MATKTASLHWRVSLPLSGSSQLALETVALFVTNPQGPDELPMSSNRPESMSLNVSLEEQLKAMAKRWNAASEEERDSCKSRLSYSNSNDRTILSLARDFANVVIPIETKKELGIKNAENLSLSAAENLIGDVLERLHLMSTRVQRKFNESLQSQGEYLLEDQPAAEGTTEVRVCLEHYLESGDINQWKKEMEKSMAMVEAAIAFGPEANENGWKTAADRCSESLINDLGPESLGSTGEEGWFNRSRLWKRYVKKYGKRIKDKDTLSQRIRRDFGFTFARFAVRKGWKEGIRFKEEVKRVETRNK